MVRLLEIRPLPGNRLFLRYQDGVEGEVNVSHLAGRGVFSLWNHPGEFEKVTIGESGEVCWNDQVDLCSNALYMQIIGRCVDPLPWP